MARRFITQALKSAVTLTRGPDLLDEPERVFQGPNVCRLTLRPRHTHHPFRWLCQVSVQGLGSSQVRAPFSRFTLESLRSMWYPRGCGPFNVQFLNHTRPRPVSGASCFISSGNLELLDGNFHVKSRAYVLTGSCSNMNSTLSHLFQLAYLSPGLSLPRAKIWLKFPELCSRHRKIICKMSAQRRS